jgi:ATP-dependent protease HslVU (ClpYQ) peptidase subunit
VTILCAFAESDGSVWIGSDQQTTAGTERWFLGPKWIVGEGWAIGFAGAHGLGHIAAQQWERLEQKEASGFAEALRAHLDSIGWEPNKENGHEPHRVGALLLVVGGRIFRIDLGLGVAVELTAEKFWAFGSGDEYAIGSAWAAGCVRRNTTEDIMRMALAAAIQFDIYCGGVPWLAKI